MLRCLARTFLRRTSRAMAVGAHLQWPPRQCGAAPPLLLRYGPAPPPLARVLSTLLAFEPDDVARVNAMIEYYENSWWHRTANLLKTDTAGVAAAPPPGAAAAAASSAASAAGSSSSAAAAVAESSASARAAEAAEASSSWFGGWFG